MLNNFSESENPYSFTTYTDVGILSVPRPTFANSLRLSGESWIISVLPSADGTLGNF